MTLFILMFLISLQGIASDSQTCGTINSRSVMEFPIQDQDGLGTCYANVASIMIQGTLQTSAPVSYQQLALAYATHESESSTLINEEKYSPESGVVCTAFEAAQEQGFCDSRFFSIEFHNREDTAFAQSSKLTAYGKILDLLIDSTSNQKQENWNAFENNLKMIFAEDARLCNLPREKYIQEKVSQELPKIVMEKIDDISTFITFAKEKYPNSLSARDMDSLTQWEKLKNDYFISTPTPDGGEHWKMKKPLPKELPEHIGKWINDRNSIKTSEPGLISDVPPPTPTVDINYLLQSSKVQKIIDDINKKWEKCGDTLTLGAFDQLDSYQMFNNPQCVEYEGVTDWQIRSLEKVAKDLTDLLKNSNRQNYGGRAKALLELIAPGCYQQMQENKKRLEGKKCNSFIFNDTFKTIGNKGAKTKPEGTPEEKKQAAKNWITQHLCQKRPISVSVCSEFMFSSSERVNTNNCRNRPPRNNTTQHALHAMTIVGSSVDEKGKIKYLVQNSWGKSCGITNPGSKGIECESNGRFWIDEDLLLDNTINLDVIE